MADLTRDQAVNTLAQWMPRDEAEVVCDWWLEFGPPFAAYETALPFWPDAPWADPWFRWHEHRLLELARTHVCVAVLDDPLVRDILHTLDTDPRNWDTLSTLTETCFRRTWPAHGQDPVFGHLHALCTLARAAPIYRVGALARRWAAWDGTDPDRWTVYGIEWAALTALCAYHTFLSPGAPSCPSSPTRPSRHRRPHG